MSINPDGCVNPMRILFGKPLEVPAAHVYKDGIHIHLSRIRKNPLSKVKGNIKTGNYLDHVMAFREALAHNCQEALLLNHRKQVAECTTSNIFWVTRGKLHTPSLRSGILKGVTRQIVFYLAEQQGIVCEEGLFPLEELVQADEVFITSTTRDVLPVSVVGEQRYPVGPITRRLMADFDAIGQVDHLDLKF